MSAAAAARRPVNVTNLPAPKKGGHQAVPYKIVSNPLPEDAYTLPRKMRQSPYRDALVALAGAKRGSVLEFEDVKALVRLRPIARKLGYMIHVAERGTKLYVQIVDTGDDK